ncbi:hypothetical protein EDC50_0732 [Vulcaniibacterium tengchongense]|uniref:Uncharacterized protein n=1 Tax=Vulcaniibacterium tengchongense TaxID=1273429 RepID=A0A3N4VQR0_9GAMM|nr:hypothetical protein EDC50_0732 [Vulcaniibacterium tengchongense]
MSRLQSAVPPSLPLRERAARPRVSKQTRRDRDRAVPRDAAASLRP